MIPKHNLIGALAFCLGIHCGRVEAVVIANDAAIVDNLPDVGSGTFLVLTQSTLSGGRVANSITNQGSGNYLFQYLGIAEAYSFFQVTNNLEFTPSYVSSHTPFFTNINNPGSGTLNLALNQSTLLAYWDDRTVAGGFVPNSQDNYGWVRLTRTASGLVVSDSATAIGEGIIVGTLTQIPEPSSNALLLGSITAAFAGFRHRPRNTR
jgi:hypothetical protein